MAKLHDKIVQIAESQIGIKEEGGNNKGDAIRKYLDATWMPEEAKELGFPWCAAFVSWVCKQARKECGFTWQDINMYDGADAYGWETWAKKQGWKVLDETQTAQPGDLVTFDFSHIGIVIHDAINKIITVEGNTNGLGTRDSDTGDGVWRKNRRRELVKTFIRLPNLGD